MAELYYKNKKNMFRLIFPIFIEQLLSATIGIADTVMVSSSGDAGVSGVSNVDVISTLLIQVFASFATGATVVISQCIGANDKKKANIAARQAVMLVTGISVIISAVLMAGGRNLLELIYGNENTAVTDYAVPYFLLSACSYPFMALFQTGSGIMRATGKSTPPMIVAFMMNIINVGGNAIFIFGFGMETTGAALATLISRIFAASVIVIILIKPGREVGIRGLFPLKIDSALLKAILYISLPTAIENCLFNLGKIVTQSFVNGYGDVEIAANAVSNNILSITLIAANTMNLSVTTVVGYCIGSGHIKESKKYIFKFTAADALMMAVINLSIYPMLDGLLSFYKVTPEAIDAAKSIIILMLIVTPLLHPLSFNVCYSLRASGDVKFTMVVAIASMFCFRVFLGYIFGTVLGLKAQGTWISMYTDWVVRACFFVPRVSSKRRKIKNLVKSEENT